MQKRTVELAVGSFFLMGLVAFTILAVKVSGLVEFYKLGDGYTLTADFENIGNLKPRARVSIAGVPVGRVLSIDFEPKHYLARVTLSIDKKLNALPVDTQANILTAGLLGDNYIALVPGFDKTVFKPGDHISVNSTTKAMILEQLISRFLAGQASDLK